MEVQINFKDITLIVQGTYIQGENTVYYYSDGSGHPGTPSDFEIDKITLLDSNVDIFELFSYDDIDEIVELVIEAIEE